MPQLPSGRAVAIDFQPMIDLRQQAEREHNPALLLLVEDMRNFCSLIRILERDAAGDVANSPLHSDQGPDDIKACRWLDTGLRVSDVNRGRAPWPTADVVAFKQFMLSDRFYHLAFLEFLCLICLRKELEREVLEEAQGPGGWVPPTAPAR